MDNTTFLADVLTYSSRMRQFNRGDWIYYVLWVGLMLGLFFSLAGFTLYGAWAGVEYPSYVWNIPIGTGIFVLAIAFDTIGHRTVYKEALARGESLVHDITIFAGITSSVLLCLAYSHPTAFAVPVTVFVFLSVLYSIIDEAMHWQRYLSGNSDRVEMWSHFFIFVGHLLMILSWSLWYWNGYPGVKQTLEALR